MSRASYRPSIHDAYIAHEAGHLLMWSRGYPAISKLDQDPSHLVWINMVNNWLSDPLINELIYERGFDISEDRRNEIRSSIKPLNKGNWAGQPVEATLQVGVSLLLEPNIEHSLRSRFRAALNRGLSKKRSDQIDAVVSMIRGRDVHRPEVFWTTSLEVLAHLEGQFHFKAASAKPDVPFVHFQRSEIDEWKQREITQAEAWP